MMSNQPGVIDQTEGKSYAEPGECVCCPLDIDAPENELFAGNYELCYMKLPKMTRYKQAEFADDDTSSIGTIQLNETTHSPGLHLRYHGARSTSLWRARTKLEKTLITTIFVLITIIFLILIVKTTPQSPGGIPKRNFMPRSPIQQFPCLNEHCIHAASEIIKSIDKTIDPCDDFYDFACNQWIQNNPIPDGKPIWGTFTKLEQQNQLIIKNVLERTDSYFKSEAEKKAKLYYQSCLDEDEVIEKLGDKPMQKFIRSVGGWNITDSGFTLKNWSLAQTLKYTQNGYNMGGLFTWAIGEDDKNSSRHIIQIDQGGISLPSRDSYLNKTEHQKVLTAYLNYMTQVGVLLGANESDSRQQMTDIIDFETKIAEITIPSEHRRNEEALYHPMKLSALQTLAPFIDWTSHLADAMKIVNRTVTKDEVVVVYAPEFLENMTNIITEYNATEKGRIILNNYLVWQGVRPLTSCLSKPFRDAYKGLRKALIGSEGGEEPWRYCVTDTNSVIGFAVGAMFVRESFHGESKPQAEQMINEVREAFKKNLKNLKWMDEQTLKAAEEKADAISDMIGFPDYILNPIELDKQYESLAIDPKAYFENNLRVNRYNLIKNLEQLDKPVNQTRWGMTPSTVNAYYTPTKNQIAFPAGILQMPFYDTNNPKSLNFGAMGVVMGHELTHAFDDQGREYDKHGNMGVWWEQKSIDLFNEKTDCISNQYAKYSVNGRNINGKQTLGENIADNGGLKAAYHAYINSGHSDNDADTLPLPGLNMTHRQLFFISFAQVWCSAATEETATLEFEKDPHSPPKYRVIGPLSNLNEFAEEFKCPIGSKMNPKKKCEVW